MTRAISIYKRVCGNCKQCINERCELIGTSVSNLRLSCVNISRSSNYVDNGYELEHAPEVSTANWPAIEAEAVKSKRFFELCGIDREVNGLCKTADDARRRVARIHGFMMAEGYDVAS